MIETHYSWSQPYEPCYWATNTTAKTMFHVTDTTGNVNKFCHISSTTTKSSKKTAVMVRKNLPSAIDDEYNDDGIYTNVDWIIMTMMEGEYDDNDDPPKEDITADEDNNESFRSNTAEIVDFSSPRRNHLTNSSPRHPQIGQRQRRPSIINWSNLQDVSAAPLAGATTLLASSDNRTKKKQKKNNNNKVSFSTTEIREYAIVVGDHPWCREGLPLALDWNYNKDCVTVIDLTSPKLDNHHTILGGARRLTYYERKNRLRRVSGFTEKQLRQLDQKRRLKQQEDKMMELGIRFPIHRHESSFANLANIN